jgi:two-component system, sensor histidine kinase RegB
VRRGPQPDPPALVASVRQLMILRSIAVAGQIAAIAASSVLGIALPLPAMACVVGALMLLNALSWWRVRSPREASHIEIAALLGFDLASFSLLLYFSGGANNPFVLIYILHAVLMALLLPLRWATMGILAVIACVVVLAVFHLPLRLSAGDPVPSGLFAIGQWLSFTLTTGVTAWFVLRVVTTLREHERKLHEASQQALRDEEVLRIGALAAGAAHELATPLTTMAVTAGEILRSAESPVVRRDADTLVSQIRICRETTAALLLAAGGHTQSVSGGRERLDFFLEAIVRRCRAVHPNARIVCDWELIVPAPEIFAEESLRQALLALLDNAVDASPDDVELRGIKVGKMVRLTIADRGSGLPAAHMDKLGRSFFTTKLTGHGAGLGLVLAARAIERLGGTLEFESREGGGTLVHVQIPLDALTIGTVA